jgi:hypothetical protein
VTGCATGCTEAWRAVLQGRNGARRGERFCSNVPPGRGRVAVCLHEHEVDPSEACKAQLVARPAQAK